MRYVSMVGFSRYRIGVKLKIMEVGLLSGLFELSDAFMSMSWYQVERITWQYFIFFGKFMS